ncbi:MAG: MCE family protein [Candidatus Schekmanbacteria bacterium]|nr:MCE family protein [Candidatus Schekmanbacteria bacterium]
MAGISTEAKVGGFVLAGMLIFAYFSIQVGVIGMPWRDTGLTLVAPFSNIAGLEDRAAVRMAGVRVGSVGGIELRGGRAWVTMVFQPGVAIPTGSRAEVSSMGLMGEKYIEVIPGKADAPPLADKAEITGSPPASMDQIVGVLSAIGEDIKAITETFRGELTSADGKERIHRIFENVDQISTDLQTTIADNREYVGDTLKNVADLTREMKLLIAENRILVTQSVTNVRDLTVDLKDRGPEIMERIAQILEKIDVLLAENRANLDATVANLEKASGDLGDTMDSVSHITRKIDEGEGTLGMLVNEETTHDNLNAVLAQAQSFLGGLSTFETALGYRGEYLGRHDKAKSYISLRVQPREDKFYLIQLVDDPRGKLTISDELIETETPEGGTETKNIHREVREDKFKISVQIAKRYQHLTFRGGLFESEGGLASDLRFFDDRLSFSAEAWRFGHDTQSPHLKLYGSYTFYPNLFVTAGWDDALESAEESVFLGAGISFTDQDITKLLGLAAAASSSQ